MRGTLRSTLNEIEGVLIAAMEPAFNKQGARFRGIARYRQVKHSMADAVSSAEIHDLVEEMRDTMVAKFEKLMASRTKRTRAGK